MNSITFLVPTKNNFESIGKLVDRIHTVCVSNEITYEILFVDDRSKDFTRAYIVQLSKYYPLHLITTSVSKGLGVALNSGIKRAKFDTICLIKGDLSYPPEELPEMLAKLVSGADIVVGEKVRTGKSNKSLYKKFINKFLHKFEFNVQSGFKIFSKRAAQWVSLSDSPRAFDLEFMYKAKKAGFITKTHQINIPEDKFGNKMGFVEATKEIVRSKVQGMSVQPFSYLSGVKGGTARVSYGKKVTEEKTVTKQDYDHKVARYTQVTYSIFALACVAMFGAWWFQPQHIPSNFIGSFHYFDIVLFILVSYIIWHPILMDVLTWSISSHIKDIRQQKPVPGLSVAFITTIVPSSESLDLLHKTLPAMVRAHYKHDTWLLDEGKNAEVRAICEKYGVHYFSRSGVDIYNTKNGKFTRTKGGNHNSWYDMYGQAYDVVAQIDTDFVPKRTFLTKTLGYFRDPEVAFVGTPQVYGNLKDSIVARGAAEQLDTFYGSVLRGLSSMRMTLLIGANHIIRTSALKGVDHYSAHITEDLITGMKLHTKGWKSVYISEALAIGEGPSTWEAYFSQQMRWAYGCMDIFFKHSPRMFKKMGLRRSIYYFFLQQHYFSGIAMALSVVLLSLYFVAGLRAADIDLFKFFASYSFIVILCWFMAVWLQRFNVDRKRFGSFQLAGKIISIAAWPVWFLAFLCIVTGKRISYKVTPKGEGEIKVRSSMSAFYPHLVFGLIALSGIIISFFTHNQSIGMLFWAGSSTILMLSIPFAQEITNAFMKVINIGANSIRKSYRFFSGLKERLTIKPRRIFIHNTARRNYPSYSGKPEIATTKTLQQTTKELRYDSIFLSLVVFLSFILYLPYIGFYTDDWSFIGNFTTSADQSLWGLIQTAFTPNTFMRPMQNIYDALLFWLFGTNPLGYQIVNAAVMLGITLLFYLIMRQLKMPRLVAITVPLVYALLPNYSTDRFWFAVFQANLCMLFYFTSLYAAIRAISYNTVWASQWKIVSVIALVLSALSYEVAVPLSLITLFVLLNPSEIVSKIIHNKKRFAQRDVIFMLAIVISLIYVFLFKVKTSTRLHDEITIDYIISMVGSAFQVNYGTWILNIPHIWGQTISLYTTQPMFIIGAMLYAAVFWYLVYVSTRKNTHMPSAKWMAALTILSFGIFLLGYMIFFTNNQVGFSSTGIDNRVAIAASVGVAMTVVGFSGFISRLLLPERFAKLLFAMCIAVMCTGSFLVINAIANFWIKAHQEGQAILADIKQKYPTMQSNTILMLDGVCPYVGPAPVFEAEWDLKGALQTHYKDATLRADVVTPRTKVNKDSIQTQIYTFPAQYPYKNLVIYNYATKTSHPIKNVDEANAYFQKYNPDFNNGCPVAHAGKGVPIF